MIFGRGNGGADPLRGQPLVGRAGAHEDRLGLRPGVLATGTLACPYCDAPVALGGRSASLTHALHCPFCEHAGALRDFLSLAAPARPARVEIRVVPGPRGDLRPSARGDARLHGPHAAGDTRSEQA